MNEPEKRYLLTLHIDMPGGGTVTTYVPDAEKCAARITEIMDRYYNRSWWKKSHAWMEIRGEPFIRFPIERLIMFTIKEEK